MRTLGKILASLLVTPLSYLLVVGCWTAFKDNVSPSDAQTIGAITLALVATLLAAVWWPGIHRRWLAALVGIAALLPGVWIVMLVSDVVFLATYSLAATGMVKGIGYIAVLFAVLRLMRHPRFTL